MNRLIRRSCLFSICAVAATVLSSHSASAAGRPDFAYALSRLAASNALQQLPAILWDVYSYAYSVCAGIDADVAHAQLYLGAGRLNSSTAYQQGQYYGAYYKYLGVVNAVQTSSDYAFNSYYNPAASYYVDYYNDYADVVADYYTSVASYYLSAGGVGTHVIYGAPQHAISEIPGSGFAFGFYRGVLTSGGPGPDIWEGEMRQGAYADVTPNVGTYYMQYGQYVGGTLSWKNAGVYYSAAGAAYSAGSAYDSNAAACFYYGLLGAYQMSATMSQYNNLAFYYLFVAASGSQFNDYYEGLAHDAAILYAGQANSLARSSQDASRAAFLASGVTLR